MDIYKQFITEQAKIFKALGHPSRLMMADSLRQGEKCVCELQKLVGDDISTISKHLSILREAGIVVSDKRGTNIYYRLAIACINDFLGCTGKMVRQRVADSAAILNRK